MSTLHFDTLAQSFLNYCAIERGLSLNTVAAYRRDLAKFSAFVSDTPVESIDSKVVADFEISLRKLRLSPSSLNRVQSTLRMFFKHVMVEKGLANPTLEIVSGKSHRRLPKALEINQVIALIDAAYHEGEPITLRDRALLELLYSSGARVSELIGINIADIATVDGEDGFITTIKLRGKGAKERIVPLGSFATKAIDDYLVRIRPSLADKNTSKDVALFLNTREDVLLDRVHGASF